MNIDKNIPIPPMYPPSPTRAACLAAMRQLEIGDSFIYLPGYVEEIRRVAELVGIHVTTRAHYDEQGMKIGWRVWRVAEPTKKSLVKRKRPLTIPLQRAA
jgi:hypothetical protein